MKETPTQLFYIQANFSGQGWTNICSTLYEEKDANQAIAYGKHDNPELEWRIIPAFEFVGDTDDGEDVWENLETGQLVFGWDIKG